MFGSLFRFVVFTNLWIGIGAASLTILSYLITQIEVNYFVVGFNGAATTFSYGLQRIKRLRQVDETSSRHEWLQNNRNAIVVILLTMLALAGVCLSFLSLKSLMLLIPLGAISLLYSNNIFLALRDIPFIKIHLISISWAVLCVGLPILEFGGISALQSLEAITLHISCFFYIMAITIPFDIRDLQFDHKSKRTIPQVVGIARSKGFALVFMGLSTALIIFISQSILISTAVLTGILIADFLGAILITRTGSGKSELFFTGTLDGLIILRLTLPLVLSFIG